MSRTRARLWLAIRLFDLPLTALSAGKIIDRPLVVARNKRVVVANGLATAAGAQAGMDLTTAQLLTGCEVAERDDAQEQTALRELSEQLYRFSPYIERFDSAALAQTGLLLEVSSCLKLFGGLQSLTDRVFAYLAQTGYGFASGLGHTASAAWYLSFAEYAISGEENRSLFIERLHDLPIDLLQDHPAALQTLTRTGFRTFGDLAAQINGTSAGSLTKRLGAEFTEAFCAIYAIEKNFQETPLFESPRDHYRPAEWFEEEIQFEYPLKTVAQLQPAMTELLQQFSQYLRRRQQQTQAIEWCIADIHQRTVWLRVNCDQPNHQWQIFYELSLIQFEHRQLPFEIDTLRLRCHQLMPWQQHSHTLDFEQSRRRTAIEDLTVTIARLKARLGEGAVYKIGYRDSRVPELSNAILSLAEQSRQSLPDIHTRALRPTWLLSRPEQIAEKGGRLHWHGYLSTLAGPERVIGEWWNQSVARDYFLARRHDNLLVWIYWDLYGKQWYVHGVFA